MDDSFLQSRACETGEANIAKDTKGVGGLAPIPIRRYLRARGCVNTLFHDRIGTEGSKGNEGARRVGFYQAGLARLAERMS
jgi:hypothetical protein